MGQIRAELLRKASGVFLWVVLVVNILNTECDHGRTIGLQKKLDEIPEKLDDLFEDILMRDNNTRAETTLCLQWILFSKRLLKLEELYFAIQSGIDAGVLEDRDPTDNDERNDTVQKFILSCSKGLVEVSKRKKTVQFIHESVRDFFLHRDGLSKVDSRLRENIFSTSENRLGECCHRYIVSLKFDGVLGSSIPQDPKNVEELREALINQHPFLEYSFRYLFEHADISQQLGSSQELFLAAFNYPDSPGLQNWKELHNLFDRYQVRRHNLEVGLLYLLSEQNRPHLVEALLNNAVDINVNALGGRYGSALQVASYNGFEAVVQLLVRANADVNIYGGEHENPLLAAALKGRTSIVGILFQMGADFSCKSTFGRTPLHHACEKGHFTTVKYLLVHAQADLNSQDLKGRTLLSLALSRLKIGLCPAHKAIVEILLERGAEIDVHRLKFAISFFQASGSDSDSGYEEIMKLIIERGADVNNLVSCYSDALKEASHSGHKAIVKQLLQLGRGTEVNKYLDWTSALKKALDTGHEAIVKLLLEKGVDIHAQGVHHSEILQEASYLGYEAIVKLLLERGANVNARGPYGYALQAASYSGNEAIVKLLLENGADVNAQSGKCSRALQIASYSRHEAIMKLLHESSALQIASYSGQEVIVRLLLENGADVNAKGGRHGSALQAASSACENGAAITKLLLEKGAKVDA